MSTPKTTFILSDGSTELTSIFPLESNGVGNQSVPNEIIDIDSSTDTNNNTQPSTVTVFGDLSQRLNTLIGTAFGGTGSTISSTESVFDALKQGGLEAGVFVYIAAVSPETASPLPERTKVTAIDWTTYTITLSAPLSSAITNRSVHFNTPFNIIDLDPTTQSPYVGEYGAASCLFNNGASTITLSNATPLETATFDIVEFSSGTNGTWTIQGVTNAKDVFYPSSKFTVYDTSITSPVSPAEYTVGMTTQSDSYEITDVVINATTTTVKVRGNIGDFFVVSAPQYQQLKITTNTTHTAGAKPLNGTHDIINVEAYSVGDDTTNIVIGTAITGSSGPANGLIEPTISTAVITVTGAFPGDPAAVVPPTASSYDVIKVGPPVSRRFSASPAITGTIPHTYVVTWYVAVDPTIDLTRVYAPGSTVTIKNNNYYSLKRLLVDSVTSDGTTISIRTTITDPGTTTPVIGSSGSIVYPAVPVPYGHIQYSVLDVASPLQLVGKGVTHFNGDTSWGQALQNNSIHQLENFRSSSEPVAPLEGQYWFNPTVPSMSIRFNDEWSGIVVSGMPVTNDIDMNGHIIYDLGDLSGTDPTQAVNMASGDLRYVNVTGDTMTGPLVMSNNAITGLADIDLVAPDMTQALNVTSGDQRYVNVTGDMMSGILDMGTNRIVNVDNPSSSQDAATKSYVDSLTSGIVWLQSVLDSNLFNDVLSTPPVLTDADMLYYRSYYVAPLKLNVVGVNASTGVWTVNGNRTTTMKATDKFVVKNNVDNTGTPVLTPANGEYTITLVTLRGDGNTDLTVSEPIHTAATITGNIYHAGGDWSGKYNRVMAWNGQQWVDVLDREVQIGDRFGIFFEVDNDEASVPNPGGSFGVGMPLGTASKSAAGKIVTVNGVSEDYVVDWGTAGGSLYPPHTPHEPDAVSVLGVNSPHYSHSYTFRGDWGTGDYNYDYKWIEFAGPAMLVDGAGLKYTGNILNVGQGTGVIVTANAVQIDATYLNTLYMRRDGSTEFTGTVSFGNNSIVNLADPYLPTSAVNLQYLTANFMSLGSTGSPSVMTGDLDMGGNQVINVATPSASTDAANKAYVDQRVSKAGDTITGPLVMSSSTGGAYIDMGTTNRIINLADPVNGADAVNLQTADGRYVNIAGDTMTGPLTLNADPTQVLHAATKQYVDVEVFDAISAIQTAVIDGGAF